MASRKQRHDEMERQALLARINTEQAARGLKSLTRLGDHTAGEDEITGMP